MHFLVNIVILFFLHLLTLSQCLKLTRVEVPSMVAMGEPFWLNCSYDLGNQGLYSIKWYHWNPDSSVNGEFFRWVPNDTPPGQMFPLKGVHLDLSKSSYGDVYLTKSDIYTDGSFRCEVSAEAPSFQTVRKEKELHVFSLPSEKPSIKGIGSDPSHYGPGDLINVSCHSKPSRPPATLSWLINGETVDPKIVKSFGGPKRLDGLESSRSDLLFYSERGQYRNGLLKLHCHSRIVQPYNVNSEEMVIGENSKYSPQLVTESMAKDVPIITGIKSTGYRIGDFVNLTCISRAKTAPKLSFTVNEVEANSSQIRPYPVFRLSDGLLASKLGLEFQMEPNDLAATSAKRNNLHFSNSPSKMSATSVRQYRVKCTASMEKTIHTSVGEVHLGTSKQSSGLHLAGNFATSNMNAFFLTTNWICVAISILWSRMP